MSRKSKKSNPIWLIAVVLAWLVPGAGHVYIGRVRRGVILFVAIAATFWAGVAMGGVMTVDRQYQRWWFTAQMLTGVHGLVGWYRQDHVYKRIAADMKGENIPKAADGRPDGRQMLLDKKLKDEGLVLANPTEGVARAYSGVAGMLNLLCIFDALMLALMGCRGEEPSEIKIKIKKGEPGLQEAQTS